jgi:predicted nucleic acid-binding protein
VPPFLDTNVLVYAYVDDKRSDRAQGLLNDRFIIGVQTLNEFANVLSYRRNWSWPNIAQASHDLQALASVVCDTTAADHNAAFHLAVRYRISIYDALMLAIALTAGCTTFYSEDLHHSLVVEDRLTILNPFR